MGQKLIPPHCLRNIMLHIAVVDHNVPSFTDVTGWIRRRGFINQVKKPPYSVRVLNKVDPPRTRVRTLRFVLKKYWGSRREAEYRALAISLSHFRKHTEWCTRGYFCRPVLLSRWLFTVGYGKYLNCAFRIFRNHCYSCVLSTSEYVQTDRGISIAGVRGHYGINDSMIHFVRINADKSRITKPSAPLRAKISFVIRRDF